MRTRRPERSIWRYPRRARARAGERWGYLLITLGRELQVEIPERDYSRVQSLSSLIEYLSTWLRVFPLSTRSQSALAVAGRPTSLLAI